jgi:hypothetical protein
VAWWQWHQQLYSNTNVQNGASIRMVQVMVVQVMVVQVMVVDTYNCAFCDRSAVMAARGEPAHGLPVLILTSLVVVVVVVVVNVVSIVVSLSCSSTSLLDVQLVLTLMTGFSRASMCGSSSEYNETANSLNRSMGLILSAAT